MYFFLFALSIHSHLWYAHFSNEMPVFVSREFSTFHEILLLMFLLTQVLFMYILWKSCQISDLWNPINMLFIIIMDVVRSHYKVRHYGKHEILLLDTCLLYLYLTPNWVGKYSGIYHKNVTHISCVVSHDAYNYRGTLLPWPCPQRNCK